MRWFFERDNYRNRLDKLLLSVYAPDDENDENLAWYYRSTWIRIATILGLPNRYLGDKTQVLSNPSAGFFIKSLLQNFFGWRSQQNPIFLLIRMLLTTCYQLLATPLRLLLNILKIGSELIPGLILIQTWVFCQLIFKKIGSVVDPQHHNHSWSTDSAYSGIVRFFSTIVAIPFVLGISAVLLAGLSVFFLGHCFTSPIQSLNEAWQVGKKTSVFRGMVYVIGVMTVVSLLYMIAFPLGIKLLTLTVLPLLPQLLSPALFQIYQFGAQILSPIFTGFGRIVLHITDTTVLPLLQGIFGAGVVQFFASIVTAMPAAVGCGVIFGGLMGVGPVLYRTGSMLLQGLGQGVMLLFQGINRRLHSPTIVQQTPPIQMPVAATELTTSAVTTTPADVIVVATQDTPEVSIVQSTATIRERSISPVVQATIGALEDQAAPHRDDDASSTNAGQYQDAVDRFSQVTTPTMPTRSVSRYSVFYSDAGSERGESIDDECFFDCQTPSASG